jgi:hypothetical protein
MYYYSYDETRKCGGRCCVSTLVTVVEKKVLTVWLPRRSRTKIVDPKRSVGTLPPVPITFPVSARFSEVGSIGNGIVVARAEVE